MVDRRTFLSTVVAAVAAPGVLSQIVVAPPISLDWWGWYWTYDSESDRFTFSVYGNLDHLAGVGTMRDVKWYDRVLSQRELNRLYNDAATT